MHAAMTSQPIGQMQQAQQRNSTSECSNAVCVCAALCYAVVGERSCRDLLIHTCIHIPHCAGAIQVGMHGALVCAHVRAVPSRCDGFRSGQRAVVAQKILQGNLHMGSSSQVRLSGSLSTEHKLTFSTPSDCIQKFGNGSKAVPRAL